MQMQAKQEQEASLTPDKIRNPAKLYHRRRSLQSSFLEWSTLTGKHFMKLKYRCIDKARDAIRQNAWTAEHKLTEHF